MKLINDGLPEPIFQAIKAREYKHKSDFSVSDLIRPPRMAVLTKKHYDRLVEKASDKLYALDGSIMHDILERYPSGGIVKQRFQAMIGKYSVSGEPDYYKNKIIHDYKKVSIWEWIFEEGQLKKDKVEQLNCYAYLMRENGFEVSELKAEFVFRDWSPRKKRRERNYPPKHHLTMVCPMWSNDKARKFIISRIKTHLEAKVNLPECTSDERWVQGEKWAVMKHGRKSALKVCDNHKDAEMVRDYHIQDKPNETFIVDHRPGESVRCLDYCVIAKNNLCEQFQRMQQVENYED